MAFAFGSRYVHQMLEQAELPTDGNTLHDAEPGLAVLAMRVATAEKSYLARLDSARNLLDREISAVTENGHPVNPLGLLQNTGLAVDTAAAAYGTLQSVFSDALDQLIRSRKAAAEAAQTLEQLVSEAITAKAAAQETAG